MYFWLKTKRIYLIYCLPIVLIACAPQPQIPTQSKFTSENSQAIALAPFYLVKQEEEADHAWYLTLKTAESKPIAGLLKPNQLLIDTVISSLKTLPEQINQALFSSGCRGQFNSQINAQADTTSAGTIEFTDYSDDCTLSLDGSVTVNVSDVSAETITATIRPENLSAKTAENQYQVTGILKVTFNPQSEATEYLASSDLSLIAVNNERYDLHNLQIKQSTWQEYPQISLNGQVDFSRYGTVTIATDSPLLVQKETGRPFDGMLTFHGSKDAWVRIFFPKAAYPGFFRLDGSDGLQTMGNL
jgi:hypothetical protein